MSTADFLSGAFALVVLLGGAAIAATVIVSRRRATDVAGIPLAIAWLTVAATFIFVAHLLPGIVGGLTSAAVSATAVMLAALSLAVPERVDRPIVSRAPRSVGEPSWVTWVGFGAVGAVAAYIVGWSLDHGGEALAQPDVVSFHLPNVVAWIQEGSLWGIHDWIPNRAPGNYPQTGDVFMLAAILPWESDFLVRFVGYPFLGLAGLAIYAAGRELAAPAGLSALTSAAVIAMPAVGYIALQGLADPEMLGTFAAGSFFLLRHWRTGDGFDLLIAGLGLGLCFVTRWYSVPAVAAVAGVWAVAALARRRPNFWRDAGALTGLIAVVGGFWLLRNWIESGNPVFPVKLAPLGITIFDAPLDTYRELHGETLAHYLTDYTVVRVNILPTFTDFLSFTAVALWAGIALAALRAFHLREPLAGRILAMAGIAALVGLVYIATPYTGAGTDAREAYTNSRYVVPALVCAAPALAWLLSRVRALTSVGAGLLGLAVLDALRRAMDLPIGDMSGGALLGGIALVALAAWVYLAGRERIRWAQVSRPVRLAALGVVVGAIALAAYVQEDRFAEARYTSVGPDASGANAAPPGSHIGIVGDGFVNYPLFGDWFENEVSYVGRREQEMLRPYDEYRPFARAVRSGGYDAIAWRDLDTLTPELPARQAKWLERLGWIRAKEGVNSLLLGTEVAVYLPPTLTLDDRCRFGPVIRNRESLVQQLEPLMPGRPETGSPIKLLETLKDMLRICRKEDQPTIREAFERAVARRD